MMRGIEVDLRECGCRVVVILNGSAFNGASLRPCPLHDPGFCAELDYYGRICWRMQHEDSRHQRKDLGWSVGTGRAES